MARPTVRIMRLALQKDETALREWLHTARDLRAESMYSGTQLHHQRKMLSYEFH